MNTVERLRPEPQPLDAAWSATTLQQILASSRPAEQRSRPRAPRRVAAAAVAATAATAALLGSTLGTSAAFAVQQDSNGDVTVTVHRLTDAAGLEKALGEHGIEAQVTYLRTRVPSDLDDGSSPTSCSAGESPGSSVDPSDDGGFTVTFERAYLVKHQGAELSLTAAGGSSAAGWSGLKLAWSDGLC